LVGGRSPACDAHAPSPQGGALREHRERRIDLVSPSDMRRYYQRALDAGRPLEIAVATGVHPYELLAVSYKAPISMFGMLDSARFRQFLLRAHCPPGVTIRRTC
jgi:hypothetical protein